MIGPGDVSQLEKEKDLADKQTTNPNGMPNNNSDDTQKRVRKSPERYLLFISSLAFNY